MDVVNVIESDDECELLSNIPNSDDDIKILPTPEREALPPAKRRRNNPSEKRKNIHKGQIKGNACILQPLIPDVASQGSSEHEAGSISDEASQSPRSSPIADPSPQVSLGSDGKCQICNLNESIYRCPKCDTLYCKMLCFKAHACKPKKFLSYVKPQSSRASEGTASTRKQLGGLRAGQPNSGLSGDANAEILNADINFLQRTGRVVEESTRYNQTQEMNSWNIPAPSEAKSFANSPLPISLQTAGSANLAGDPKDHGGSSPEHKPTLLREGPNLIKPRLANKPSLPVKVLKEKALKAHVALKLAPRPLTRRVSNTTCLSDKGKLRWRIEWVFVLDKVYSHFDKALSEEISLSFLAARFFNKSNERVLANKALRQALAQYTSSEDFCCLLDDQSLPANERGWLLLDVSRTIKDAISCTLVVEFPTFFLVPKSQVHFSTIPPTPSDQPLAAHSNTGSSGSNVSLSSGEDWASFCAAARGPCVGNWAGRRVFMKMCPIVWETTGDAVIETSSTKKRVERAGPPEASVPGEDTGREEDGSQVVGEMAQSLPSSPLAVPPPMEVTSEPGTSHTPPVMGPIPPLYLEEEEECIDLFP